jgi:N-acetylglucosaminyldiphosphoundecaprenol N-acetyl-beta-D-mannosaminyltransferase
LFGYPIAAKSVEGCLDQVVSWLEDGERRRYVACINPHSLVVADGDPNFRQALLGAHLLVPDGVGILLGSRILGGKIRKLVTGSDIFSGLSRRLDQAGERRYSYFFLGASEKTLGKISTRLSRDYPGIRLAGVYSPPFKAEFTADDSRRMIEAVNAARPDVLWVGMTAPKQEKWVHENLGLLDVKLVGAIGAVFDFYAGNVTRSHPIFRELGLEWLPRLCREPRRLWRRNFVSSPVFLAQVIRERLGRGWWPRARNL